MSDSDETSMYPVHKNRIPGRLRQSYTGFPLVQTDSDYSGRNFFIAPRYFQTDVSISKKFKLTERFNFDLRLDATNVTNNPSFDNPTATFTSTTFGRIRDSVTIDARRMQVSLRLDF